MSRKKPAYRRRGQNRLAMIMVTLVLICLMGVITVKSIELLNKQQEYIRQEEELQAQYEAQLRRKDDIEEFRRYTKTDAYVEEVAKDRLGLVYDGEIIFREKD